EGASRFRGSSPTARQVDSDHDWYPWQNICMSVRVVVGVTVVALLEPATEAGSVRVDAVERLELLAVGRVDRLELGPEGVVEGLGDVTVVAEGGLRDLGPPAQDLLGLDQRAHRVGHEAEMRERDTGGAAFGEAAQR